MKLTKFTILRRNISYWFMLRYNFFYMLIYSILWLIFCFWDAVIVVIKVKYEINKIYVIKAKYKILVIANLWWSLYAQLLCFITFLCFWDAVIYFEITRCQCLVCKFDRELKILELQNEPPKKERVGFSNVLLKRTKSLMVL